MTIKDLQDELHYQKLADRPAPKGSETLTRFDRDIFYYSRGETARQEEILETLDDTRVTYKDHVKAISTAIIMFGVSTQHGIAMEILSNRWFKDYRAKVFQGKGTFTEDYTFLVTKVGMVFNPSTSKLMPIHIASKIAAVTGPVLIQANYITGTIKTINVSDKFSLTAWADKYNMNAVESTVYHAIPAPIVGDTLKAA